MYTLWAALVAWFAAWSTVSWIKEASAIITKSTAVVPVNFLLENPVVSSISVKAPALVKVIVFDIPENPE